MTQTFPADPITRHRLPEMSQAPVERVPSLLVVCLTSHICGRDWQVDLSSLFDEGHPEYISSPVFDAVAFQTSLDTLSDKTGFTPGELAEGVYLAMHFATFNSDKNRNMDLSMLCPSPDHADRLHADLKHKSKIAHKNTLPSTQATAGVAFLLSLSALTSEAYSSVLMTISESIGDASTPVRASDLRDLLEGSWPKDTPETILIPAAISAGANCAMTQDRDLIIWLDGQYADQAANPVDRSMIVDTPLALNVPSIDTLVESSSGWITPDRLARALDCMSRPADTWDHRVPNLLNIHLDHDDMPRLETGVSIDAPEYALRARQAVHGSEYIEIGKLRFHRIHPDLPAFTWRVSKAIGQPDHPLKPFPTLAAHHLETMFKLPAKASTSDFSFSQDDFIPTAPHKKHELEILLATLAGRNPALWQCDLLIEGEEGSSDLDFYLNTPEPENAIDKDILAGLAQRQGRTGQLLEDLYTDLRLLDLVEPAQVWQRRVGNGRTLPSLLIDGTLFQKENVPLQRHINHMDECGVSRIAWFDNCVGYLDDTSSAPAFRKRSFINRRAEDGRPARLWSIVMLTLDS